MAHNRNPAILAVGTALPPHFADQEEIVTALKDAWGKAHYNLERLEQLHRAVQVKGRYLARPLEGYAGIVTFAQRNDAWLAAALDVGEEAIRKALGAAGLEPHDIDHLLVVTTTGIATPGLDARLINRLGLRRDVVRTPIFGLGCAGGAGGIARAADYLRAYPEKVAVMLSAEICSLTLQREDISIPNIIASALFGDGAAAAVLAGGQSDAALAGVEAPRISANGAAFYPDTERVMGWDIVDSGFKIVLSARVPEVVRANIRTDVDEFLATRELGRGDIDHWIIHTGGPRVLEAFTAALELAPEALDRSWRSLAAVGNLSSASVLFVLEDFLTSGVVQPGDRGVLAAVGPGFSSELVLLEW